MSELAPQERRLTAILAADIVGFTRLIEADETGTLAGMRSITDEVIEPALARHSGRMVKTTGDGLIVEFSSVLDAVACGMEIQSALTDREAHLPASRRIQYRIGVNLGDVVVNDGDLLGDGVNIACRLESIAEPGSVYINDTVHRQLSGKIDQRFDDLGLKKLKNIERPVQVWRWTAARSQAVVRPSLPENPSLAVLAFSNMSNDPEQEFFSDGIAEDILTQLSKYKSLFVVARSSSFVYRGRAVDIREVGRALGVQFVLEGSVRKAGDRILVTAQLIEAATGDHVWAERFEGDAADLFEFQDEVSRTIVSTIAGRVHDHQAERLEKSPTSSLTAYEQVLRGQKLLQRYTLEDYTQAAGHFGDAIRADPDFARAHAYLALVEAYCWFWEPDSHSLKEAIALAERGMMLDPHEPKCHLSLGLALMFSRSLDKAAYHLGMAGKLNPNDDLTMVETGRLRMYEGNPAEGAQLVRRAMRRNPYHPNWYWNILGRCFHTMGEYGHAIDAFNRLTKMHTWTHVYLAACHSALAHQDSAIFHHNRVLELDPDFSLDRFALSLPYQNRSDLDRFIESLRSAGFRD